MADPETIYNWRRLDDITTSGQPTEPQLADIHDESGRWRGRRQGRCADQG